MRDKLIELIKQIEFDYGEECVIASEDDYGCVPDLAEFFADRLLAEGVIIPPCKVGDKVYVLSRYYDGIWRIYECRVCDFTIYKTNIFMALDSEDEPHFGLHISEMGKTVFLTKEQAEKALAEVANGT